MSMPTTAISTAGTLALAAFLGMGVLHSDGAPSSGHYRPQSGQEHGRTIPLTVIDEPAHCPTGGDNKLQLAFDAARLSARAVAVSRSLPWRKSGRRSPAQV